jgi:hypothetical protein
VHLLFGHNRAFDLNLPRLVIDDNVVRMRDRIRPINAPTVILGEDTSPVLFAFDCCADSLGKRGE